jgi:hypothetical protein
MGNRTRDLPACSAMPQPNVLPRTQQKCIADENMLDPSRSYTKTVVAICNRFHFLSSEHTRQLFGPG